MKILAVDGNSIFYRAYYGIRLLSTKEGIFTNAIYGFLNILLKELEEENPDGVIIAFDLPKPTFRHIEYKEYKAGRKPAPDELKMQMPIIQEILPLMGIKVVTMEGFEADDILGSMAKLCCVDECVILTGDRDSLQLISDSVKIKLVSTRMGKTSSRYMGKAEILEEYLVDDPKLMIDIKALMGDSSDNIPGVAGIGPKTACSLVSKYGKVEEIYEKIDELEVSKGVKDKLVKDKDNAILSRFLGEINCDVPIEQELDYYRIDEGNKAELAEKLQRLELATIIKRMGLESVAPEVKKTEVAKREATDVEFSALPTSGRYAVCYKDDKISLCGEKDFFFATCSEEQFKEILENKNIEKIVFDSKKIYKEFSGSKNITFCLVLSAYLINPISTDYNEESLSGIFGLEVGETVSETAELYYNLYCLLLKDLEQKGMDKLLFEIEMPLARVLASMENYGIKLDTEGLRAYGEELDEKIANLQKEIYAHVDYEFNINSPKQLGKVLFEDLELPAKKKTKNGYSTNAEVLESLAKYHVVPQMVIAYRQVAKLRSTYVDSLIDIVDENSRLHTTFIQTVTRTGRLSSAEPNLQNIPIRTQLGGELRKFFIPKEGFVLVDADYSQIELRVLAHMSDDKTMQEAFASGVDIHTKTASEMFGIPVEMVVPSMRSRAKAINFGIVYGMGAFSLAKDTGVSVAEASGYIKNYFETYKNVKIFLDTAVESAKENGYSTTMFGRKREIPEIKNSNKNLAAVGERIAKNTPIQGSAADIIKIAMINVQNMLEKENLKSRLILQVHDELIIETATDEVEQVKELLKYEMENAVKMSVVAVADVHTGNNWLEAK